MSSSLGACVSSFREFSESLFHVARHDDPTTAQHNALPYPPFFFTSDIRPSRVSVSVSHIVSTGSFIFSHSPIPSILFSSYFLPLDVGFFSMLFCFSPGKRVSVRLLEAWQPFKIDRSVLPTLWTGADLTHKQTPSTDRLAGKIGRQGEKKVKIVKGRIRR